MSKPKLYIDYDNVIVGSNEVMPIVYEELTGIKPKSCKSLTWNMYDLFEKEDLHKDIIHKIFEVERFFELAKPYKGCLKTIFNLSKYYDVYIVSVGSTENLRLKKKWLLENIPFIPENNLILLEQVGKANSIDKSCCVDGVLIDDTLSALLSSKNCLRVLFRWNNDKLSWQDGYEELLLKDEIHKVVTEWNQEFEEYLIGYAQFLER